ncbi:MipA/OmpV family protein [Marinobacter sp. 1_MG-2023]|uniref:MipA/OmpV family protein n=1 Tax=Marinobacter sp. 1_MG-2023 TaxID=3062627 RepID=UPI0026E2C73F|nr:MipA/OmpV family protein [Marinobacter sp. 1_MG-2023]MDO6824931.1 MipA/OmpV family protein [Marinobacter sp. 1_MG-2023]
MAKHMAKKWFFVVAAGLLLSSSLEADNQVTQIPFADTPAGTVGLGAGLRFGRSPYRGVESLSSLENENNADRVPLYLYEGEYLFSHGTRAGLHLWDDSFRVDAVVQYRFDRLEPETSDFYRTVEKRSQTLEGGLALNRLWGTHEFSVNLLNDIQGHHNGYVTDLTYRQLLDYDRLRITPYISLIYQSEELVDYYYGVSAGESRSDLPDYHPEAVYLTRLGLNSSYRVFEGWHVFANLSWEQLDKEIRNSPLVDEDQIYMAFLGFHYEFGNVFDQSSPSNWSVKDWSWRIQTGYQAEGTFHKSHRGDLSRSKDVDAYLAGLTLGKLLSDGDVLDFWGKVSMNRRFENGMQENFWDYSAYVMAMGTGYSPWSQREVFRYGFGFGFDYAERIPMVEQIKQERKGRYTSHFLNYLEAQVDVPLRNFIEAKSVRNCYAGITLIHRSGIFATSDILGNVSGGSDVVAGHLECKR